MKLPHGDEAVVPLQKLTEYLLSESHPVGSSKAAFFRGLGFGDANVHLFEESLRIIARSENAVEIMPSTHGTKYVVDGEIETPLGRLVAVRTIWIVERNQHKPRFVTAYPR